MPTTRGYAAMNASAPLTPWEFERREVGENDISIAIEFAGICHSDIHQAREDWGKAKFPMVPGHEIVGRVTEIGSKVSNFKVGDLAISAKELLLLPRETSKLYIVRES